MATFRCTTFLLLVSAAWTLGAGAQDQDAPQQTAPASAPGAPARAVVRAARLSYFSGEVSVQRTDNTAPESGSDAAVLNMPLAEGTRLVAGEDGQAEVEFEDGSVARLTPKSSLAIDALSVDAKSVAHTQMTLLGGVAYFELRQAPGATYRVDAGGIRVIPIENTVMRVSFVQPPAVFAVVSGAVETDRPASSEDEDEGFHAEVKSGESLRADPDDASRYFLSQEIANDSWDAWNQGRDQAAAADASTRTAARDAYAGSQGFGWSDLDANGTWYNMPGSDGTDQQVWQPAEADMTDAGDAGDGFDPYGDGAFVWSGGGYLYASGYSWGWLPYRCGRWDWYAGFGWAWRPNRFCRVWGFGGGGGGIGHRPPHYKVVSAPIPGPGGVHPIHRIHTNPVPPRAVPLHHEPVKIAGVVATPLPPVGQSFEGSGGVVGGALYRDYPVEVASKRPVLGIAAKPVSIDDDLPVSGWVGRASQPRPAPVVTGTAAPVHREPARSAPAPTHAAPPPAASHSAPPAPAPTASKPK